MSFYSKTMLPVNPGIVVVLWVNTNGDLIELIRHNVHITGSYVGTFMPYP